MILKERFFSAINAGELGYRDEDGVIIVLKAFKQYFSDVPRSYGNAFLPAATIEPGRTYMTDTKYLYRISPGVYRLHPDALNRVYISSLFHGENTDRATSIQYCH
jgi:hypothetical protein